MALDTVIFDMDGLLIDSEPLWQEAGMELLSQHNITLTDEQYHHTTGLRTPEWIEHWFGEYNIDRSFSPEAITSIHQLAISKIGEKGIAMRGIEHIMQFFKERNFKIGIASSSPMALINVVTQKLGIGKYVNAYTSAEELPYGKPHPQVFLNCAEELGVNPNQCIVFEDSFNGMIAAKAARMKCVIVPAPGYFNLDKWAAADLKIEFLDQFSDKHLEQL
jgi:mannitol-1-/sugar-/sorbitol-6-/2-deoxyglucose-6-phosphatase